MIGAELRIDHPGVRDILAFGAAFLGAVGLWWVYFDRAADERVLTDPGAHGSAPTAWLILGGTALFLAGHALFKGIFWHVASWSRWPSPTGSPIAGRPR